MKLAISRCVLMAATSMLPLTVFGQARAVPFVQADTKAEAIELVSEPRSYDRSSQDAFTELGASSRCSTTRVRESDVTLTWEVTRSEVQAHRIDITQFRDGFNTGRYLTSGERTVASGAASEGEVLFESAEPGLFYYWRLLTKTPSGWIVSGAGRFEAPVCPVDENHH